MASWRVNGLRAHHIYGAWAWQQVDKEAVEWHPRPSGLPAPSQHQRLRSQAVCGGAALADRAGTPSGLMWPCDAEEAPFAHPLAMPAVLPLLA